MLPPESETADPVALPHAGSHGYIRPIRPETTAASAAKEPSNPVAGPAVDSEQPDIEKRAAEADTRNGDNDAEVDAEVDLTERPPYSYARLAVMAITALGGRAKVPEIYSWIQNEYPYYKNGTQYWKNCIRHNLSIKKFFQRSGPFWYYFKEMDETLDSRKGVKQPKADGAVGMPTDAMAPMMVQMQAMGGQNLAMTQMQLQAQMAHQQRYIDQRISAMAQEATSEQAAAGPGSPAQEGVRGRAVGMPMGMTVGHMSVAPAQLVGHHQPMTAGPVSAAMRPQMAPQMMPSPQMMIMPGMRPPMGQPMHMPGQVPPGPMMDPRARVMVDAVGRRFVAVPSGAALHREEAWSSLRQAAEILRNPAAQEAYDEWRRSGVLLNRDEMDLRSRNPSVYRYDPSQQYDGMPLIPQSYGAAPPMGNGAAAAATKMAPPKATGRASRKALIKLSSDAGRPEKKGDRLKRFQTDGATGSFKLRRVDSDGGSFLHGAASALVPRSEVKDKAAPPPALAKSQAVGVAAGGVADRAAAAAATPAEVPTGAPDEVVAGACQSEPEPSQSAGEPCDASRPRRATFGPARPRIGFHVSSSAIGHFRAGGTF
mmetsp:Transcript_28135/g.84128  ORF Transcript_28135/g.84128 Transcript_28135/m.84128 type:complete len:596 (+) Transcript_28135:162-1949(+)